MNPHVALLIGRSPITCRRALIERFRGAAQGKLGSAIWIGPSKEATDQIRAQLGSMIAPRLFDWDSLALFVLRQLGGAPKVVSHAQQRLLVQEAIAKARRDEKLPYFARIADTRGFLLATLGTLEELHDRGIDQNQFQSLVSGDAEEDGRSRKRVEAAAIVERYLHLLQIQNRYDSASLLRLVEERLASTSASPFARVEQIFVDGCEALTPRRLDLLRRLSGVAWEIHIGVLDDGEHEREELFRMPRATGTEIEKIFTEVERLIVDDVDESPAGLSHLRRAIFSNEPALAPADDADGISIIEAPGALGEARLVARQIRHRLAEGTPPERILVTARHLAGNKELLSEIFDEYAVPFDMEGDEALARDPLVLMLLKAVRLPEDDFPFSGVTALLRNSFFRPTWPECAADDELPRHAETLLRMLGEPRGDQNVLRAVDIWAQTPPPSLEDESAEESRRKQKIKLAQQTRPFLKRFFQMWNRFPRHGTLEQYALALREFTDDLGLNLAVGDPQAKALLHLFQELDAWTVTAQPGSLSRASFVRLLNTIAASPMPMVRTMAGRVRIREAESAIHLEADCLFILGLGEKSFPDLSPPDSLIDDADRQWLRQRGLPFVDSDNRLSGEMLLFYRLIALPVKSLVLCYPAMDPKGQLLLPSAFLRSVRECFAENAIPAERQRMLIEGYFEQTPIADSERRVRFAAAMKERQDDNTWKAASLPDSLTANLHDAARMAHHRFAEHEFGVYDGMLNDPKIIAHLQERFGPKKTFSPTALEAYVACPFRFFFDSVLRLNELDEPVEEVEASRRGSAFHRALARYHQRLRNEDRLDAAMTNSNEEFSAEFQRDLGIAIKEYQQRASTEATGTLWDLEGKRLARSAAQYHDHWRSFVDPWRKEKGAVPAPKLLEADFGLPTFDALGNAIDPEYPALTIQVNGVEVRIGGRIDRVDVAELAEGLGFWIIDYKTGRSDYYTGKGLEKFEKLQLSLYALAVQRIFFNGEARPLGLAYWLVTDHGVKPVLPGAKKKQFSWLEDEDNWNRFRQQLEEWVAKLASNIRRGHFPLSPRKDDCTSTCSFGQICRISQSRATGKVFDLKLPGTDDIAKDNDDSQ